MTQSGNFLPHFNNAAPPRLAATGLRLARPVLFVPIALCSSLLRAGLFFGFGESVQCSVFRCAVFSVQFKTSTTSLHTTHATSRNYGVNRQSLAGFLRLSSGSSHQYRSPGTNRGFCEAGIKPSTFSLWPLVWSLGPAPAACRIECRTTNALGHYRHWITVSIHTETGRSFMATACTCRHNRASISGLIMVTHVGRETPSSRELSRERKQLRAVVSSLSYHLLLLLSCSPAPATLRRPRHRGGLSVRYYAHLYTIFRSQIGPRGKKA